MRAERSVLRATAHHRCSRATRAAESTTRARDDLRRRERIANDQHQQSAHHCSRERAQISIAARRRERRRAASPPWDIAPGRRVSHAHERLKNPAAHGQGSDLESFEHGISALEAARGRLRPALKSPIGPIGTSIPAAYGVCEHRDNGSEPIASRQPLGVTGFCLRHRALATRGAAARRTRFLTGFVAAPSFRRMGLPASGARITPEGCHTEQKRYGAARAGANSPRGARDGPFSCNND